MYRKAISVTLFVFILLINGWLLTTAQVLPAPKTVITAVDNTTPLCRFSVNGSANPVYDTSALRIGWYIDYQAQAAPAEPNGADYTPMIRLTQVSTNTYSYSPSGTQLTDAIAGNLGAVWLIGNEPDRRDVQDDIEPHLYAQAYHDLYALIKAEDPSARIFAGNIVQPTPLRLQYLDMILSSYQSTYGTAMPVDGWSIHNFLLNEDCDGWGASVPPGIACTAPGAVTIGIDETDDTAVFQQRIIDFRTWMKDNGYKETPLYVTEYGILMPQDFNYPSSRVNAYMTATFDYMRTAVSPTLGYAADNDLLVQKWSWYSVDDNGFNGWLFDPANHQLTDMGTNYRDYTAVLQNEVDVLPAALATTPPSLYSNIPITFTLEADIANIGYMPQDTAPLNVRFYDGDPNMGGVQIGATQVVAVGGGQTAVATVEWSNVPPGAHPVYIVVDDAAGECSFVNNTATFPVLVATERTFLPLVRK